MSADRLISNSTSPGPITGPDHLDEVQEEFTGLWNKADILLNGIGGDGDAITATCNPAIIGPVLTGMQFMFVTAADNTGAVTLKIDALAPISVRTAKGAELVAGQLDANTLYSLALVGGQFRLKTDSSNRVIFNKQVFTADGTWVKPANLADDGQIKIEAWGAGGSGSVQAVGGTDGRAGGGGGAYAEITIPASEVDVDLVLTVPGIPAVGAAGGSATVVNDGTTILTALGGGEGEANGGTGAGYAFSGKIGDPVSPDAGQGGVSAVLETGQAGRHALGHGGGGGGAHSKFYDQPNPDPDIRGEKADGGKGQYGGGGGGGDADNASYVGDGGTSKYGGNGGASGVAGQVPGGGGGYNASGGRGEVRITVIG